MSAQSGATLAPTSPASVSDSTRLYQEGMIAGVLGAAAVAVWFLLLDAASGRPLYTPTVLGTALFRRGAGLAMPETLGVSLEMVLMFTWVHGMVFAGIGGLVARLLGFAERNPHFGFGVLLIFVIFQFGFIAAATVFAPPVLRVLSPLAILIGNLFAASAMAVYFWRRHPNLHVSP